MSLRVWLPLDGNLNNQGLGSPTITGTATFDANGKIGKCLNSSNSIVVKNTGIENSRIWSVCFWGYVDSSLVTSNWINIIYLGDNGGWLRVQVCPKTNYNGIHIYTVDNPAYEITSGNIPTSNGLQYYDKWVHFCLTSDGTTIKRYLNGIFNGSAIYDGMGALTGNLSLENNDKIKKNDFRIYDHCLSPKEVKEISKGLCLHYKLNNRGWGGENLITDSYKERSGTVPETNISNIKQWTGCITPNPDEFYACSFDAKSNIDGVTLSVYLYNSNNDSFIQVLKTTNSEGKIVMSRDGHSDFTLTSSFNRYWITWQFDNVTPVEAKNLLFRLETRYNANFSGQSATIKNVKLEKGSKATSWCPNKADALYQTLGLNSIIEPDCSGYRHNAERVGTLQSDSDSPRYDSATYFDGNSYIGWNTSDFTLNLRNGFTFSCWVKYKEFLNTTDKICGITIAPDGSSTFNFGRDGGGGSGQFIVFFDNTDLCHAVFRKPELDVWHHYCGTWDGTVNKLYIDGEFVANGYPRSHNFSGGAESKLGAIKTTQGNQNSVCDISDFRLYSTVLSEEDIKELYRTSASIANNGTLFAYEFKEE